MKLTIKDIAKLAGVSKATVSRVLNNSKPVSPEVKKKVMKVIEENDYQPSHIARSLSKKETKLIGMIIPDISNSVFAKITEGVEREATLLGYNVLLCTSRYSLDLELDYLNVMRDKQVDGIIYHGFMISEMIADKLVSLKKPVVSIGIGFENHDIPVIMINNKDAAYEATKHLIDKGHKEIAMIHGPLADPYAGKLRYDGYTQALNEIGVEVNENLLAEGNYKLKHGYKAMEKIFESDVKPTGVFCANDAMAIGAMKCIIDRGYEIPEDIAVIGFDDIDIAEIYSPSLTTIAQPFEEKGEAALKLLINMMKHEDVEKPEVHEHKLIKREST